MRGMNFIIQIYEIQDPREAEVLVQLGVDHIGSVILSEDDWKREEIKEVVSICREGKKKSSMIFLFQDMDTIKRAIEYYMPDIVHFCEYITNSIIERHIERQIELKSYFPFIQIMRSIPVPEKGRRMPLTIEEIKRFEPYTDIFLIDTYVKDEPVKGYIGITGRTCDWDIARNIVKELKRPVILGGGLNPENVYEAIKKVEPDGVDSCTGTNATDKEGIPIRFKKDINKVKKFIEGCRRYEREREKSKGST